MNEHLLELYARAPDTLDRRTRAYIEAEIERSGAVKAVVSYWTAYYEEWRQLTDYTSPVVERFVDDLFKPSLVELRPLKRRDSNGPRVTVLAALTKDPVSQQRFETVATLGDESEGIVVRVLYDHERGTGRLYVLSDQEEDRQYAVVSIPDLSRDVITDASGHSDFSMDDTERGRFAQLTHMILRRQRATCSVNATDLRSGTLREYKLSPENNVRIVAEPERLHIEVVSRQKDARPYTLLAADFGGTSPNLVHLADGACDVELGDDNDRGTLRFYH